MLDKKLETISAPIMADTTIACQNCFRKIKEEAPLHSLCYDSMLYPKLLAFPVKVELSIEENPVACNECKHKSDEGHKVLMQNETTLENAQSFLTNSPSLVNEENYFEKIKEEFVEVAIKNENEDIVKEECVLFNPNISVCVEEFTVSDMLYYCYHCNYVTSDKQILTNHIFTHLFKCNLCRYITFDNSSLRRHEEVHFNVTLNGNVLECYNCGYQSRSEFSVLTHKKRFMCNCIHNKSKNSKRRLCKYSEERHFSCDMCDYKCRNKSNLIHHNRKHTQEKPFRCNVCDYCCSQAGSLKTHMYQHSGEKPFSCDKCDYRCCSRSDLTKHNRKHTQEKPFKCNVCDYCCSQASTLKTHMYKHTGERPFSCDMCDYKCYKKSALTLHNRTHTQEKPFKCNVCNYCTNQLVNLKSHMYKHSGERPFSCDKCAYRCSQKSALTRHNRTHT